MAEDSDNKPEIVILPCDDGKVYLIMDKKITGPHSMAMLPSAKGKKPVFEEFFTAVHLNKETKNTKKVKKKLAKKKHKHCTKCLKAKVKDMHIPCYIYRFKSDTGSRVYETIIYRDGYLSCDCMGWTRRVTKKGTRSCKHTRMLETEPMERCVKVAVSHGAVGEGMSAAEVEALPKAVSKSIPSLPPSYEREFS